MKRELLIVLAIIVLLAPSVRSQEADTTKYLPGLVAHYFMDTINWDGNWPDSTSMPSVDPAQWTFTEYKYSRIEPVVNHLFIRKGWFSVRWTGYFDPAISDDDQRTVLINGNINVNPNNSDQNEFTLILPDGSTITRDNLTRNYAGYVGAAVSLHLKPKGNGNQNGLTVDDRPFTLVNANTYDISADRITVKLYNDRVSGKGVAKGDWWIAINAVNATIVSDDKGNDAESAQEKSGGTAEANSTSKNAADADEHQYFFEIHADDGCRLSIDGKAIIDDWRACSEDSPDALRKARPIRLKDGKHRIVIEYFQGQSLIDADHDPIRLYWSCPSREVAKQIVQSVHFFHGIDDVKSSDR